MFNVQKWLDDNCIVVIIPAIASFRAMPCFLFKILQLACTETESLAVEGALLTIECDINLVRYQNSYFF